MESLLKTTTVGRKLLENASLGPLSKDSQNELVTIIANRHLELKFPTKKDVLKQYAEAVTDLFKHETKVLEESSRRLFEIDLDIMMYHYL